MPHPYSEYRKAVLKNYPSELISKGWGWFTFRQAGGGKLVACFRTKNGFVEYYLTPASKVE